MVLLAVWKGPLLGRWVPSPCSDVGCLLGSIGWHWFSKVDGALEGFRVSWGSSLGDT